MQLKERILGKVGQVTVTHARWDHSVKSSLRDVRLMSHQSDCSLPDIFSLLSRNICFVKVLFQTPPRKGTTKFTELNRSDQETLFCFFSNCSWGLILLAYLLIGLFPVSFSIYLLRLKENEFCPVRCFSPSRNRSETDFEERAWKMRLRLLRLLDFIESIYIFPQSERLYWIDRWLLCLEF